MLKLRIDKKTLTFLGIGLVSLLISPFLTLLPGRFSSLTAQFSHAPIEHHQISHIPTQWSQNLSFDDSTRQWQLIDPATAGLITLPEQIVRGPQAFSFQLVSASLDFAENPLTVEYRLATDNREWTAWHVQSPLNLADRPDDFVFPTDVQNFELVFLGGPKRIQWRIWVSPNSPAISLKEVNSTFYYPTAQAKAQQQASASVNPANIISRNEWNPNNANCKMSWTPRHYKVEKIVIHHTADNRNGLSTLNDSINAVRATCHYHSVSLGWGDIGYNYLISPTGHIFEGRGGGEGVEAGHAYAANRGSVGIAMLGTFSTENITPAARESLIRLLADLSQRYRLDPTATNNAMQQGCYVFNQPTIAGHREYQLTPLKNMDCNACSFANDYNAPNSGGLRQSKTLGCPATQSTSVLQNNTACPGNALIADLSSIRTAAQNLLAPHPGIGGFRAEYYPNPNLEGTPFTHRVEGSGGKFAHNWGAGSPLSGFPADNFSVRWRGVIDIPEDGIYTFQLGSDDGSRLFVNNEPIINQWQDQAFEVKTAHVGLSKGRHQVRVEYYERGGDARVSLNWFRRQLPNNRFIGYYYNNAIFQGPAILREEEKIDFDWGTGSPIPGRISSDYFSVIWRGQIEIKEPDNYIFEVAVDDRVRLFVGDMQTPLINQWQDQVATFSAIKPLEPGTYPVRMEFMEAAGGAAARLSWSPSSAAAFSSPGGLLVRELGGATLATLGANQPVRVSYNPSTNRYYIRAGNLLRESASPINLVSRGGDPPLIEYSNFGKTPHKTYKRFRGEMVLRAANGALHVINRVGVEDYLRGLGETGLNSHPEYTRAIVTSARTYALYHYQNGGKHKASGYTIDNTGNDQVYYGYDYEIAAGPNPILSQAVTATNRKVITHPQSNLPNKLIIATYFSQVGEHARTCGRTRTDICTWNVGGWPWIPENGVSDPWWMKDNTCFSANNQGRGANRGHGYGMSGRGAYCFAANDNFSWQQIIYYYYSGVSIQDYPTNTNSVRLDIGLESLPFQDIGSVKYPDGSLVKSPTSATIYYISAGQKRPFVSAEIFLSHADWSDVTTIPEADLALYPLGRNMPFKGSLPLAEGSLVKTADSPAVYLIEENFKRQFPSAEVFLSYGHSWNQIQVVTNAVLNRFATDAPVTYLFVPKPNGTLIKADNTPSVYFIDGGKRRVFNSAEAFLLRGHWWDSIHTVSSQHVSGYPSGSAITASFSPLPENTLIKASNRPEVYKIEDKKVRIFPDATVFLANGFNWSQIRTVDDTHISAYAAGAVMRFPENTLIKGSGPEVYKTTGTTRRIFPSGDIFLATGHQWNNIVSTSDSVVNSYANGPAISYTFSPRNNNTLIKTADSPVVYRVNDGRRHPFPRGEVFLSHGYRWNNIITITNLEMGHYTDGAAVKFKNGSLVKSEDSPQVYLIQQDIRRPIPSAEVFNSHQFNWNAIIQTDRHYLESTYPLGSPLGTPQNEAPPAPPGVLDVTPGL